MANADSEPRAYNGKVVVIVFLVGMVLFTVGSIVGTKGLARFMQPYLSKPAPVEAPR